MKVLEDPRGFRVGWSNSGKAERKEAARQAEARVGSLTDTTDTGESSRVGWSDSGKAERNSAASQAGTRLGSLIGTTDTRERES